MKQTAIKMTFIPLVITMLFFSFVESSLAIQPDYIKSSICRPSVNMTADINFNANTNTATALDSNTSATSKSGCLTNFFFHTINPTNVSTLVFTSKVNVTSGVCSVGYSFLNNDLSYNSISSISATSSQIFIATTTSPTSIRYRVGFYLGLTNSTSTNCSVQILSIKDNLGFEYLQNSYIILNTQEPLDTSKIDLFLETIATIMLILGLIWCLHSGITTFYHLRK